MPTYWYNQKILASIAQEVSPPPPTTAAFTATSVLTVDRVVATTATRLPPMTYKNMDCVLQHLLFFPFDVSGTLSVTDMPSDPMGS